MYEISDKKILRTILKQPFMGEVRVFLKKPNNIFLLVVIVCAFLSLLVFAGFTEKDLDRALFFILIIFSSVMSFGIGIMLADAFTMKYTKRLILGSLLFLVLITVIAYFYPMADITNLVGAIGMSMISALLFRNARLIHNVLKSRKIRITITN